VAVRLTEVAEFENLATAFWRAAKGKRHRPEVASFGGSLETELSDLQRQILAGAVVPGAFRSFRIHDPKPRLIHAPSFRDRVLHHALLAKVGPVFERSLVADTFACRSGKGPLAAVRRCQAHLCRFPWYLQLDIRAYFHSIDHSVLRVLIRQRLKDPEVLALCDRIIAANDAGLEPETGLPIGALTSQHFANLYLGGLDRLILENLRASGMVRYMDDIVIWDREPSRLREIFQCVREFAAERLHLQVKANWRLQRSRRGLTLCGFRVYPRRLHLAKRRRRRYRISRQAWERVYALGLVDAKTLQAGYSAALAITAGADAALWRLRDLQRHPAPDA